MPNNNISSQEINQYFDAAIKDQKLNKYQLVKQGLFFCSLGLIEEGLKCFDTALKIDADYKFAMNCKRFNENI